MQADPGIGRPDAPIGSLEWAQYVRLQSQLVIDDAIKRPASVKRYVDTLVKLRAWTMLNKPDGSYFATWEEFCAHPKPYGWGMPWAKLKRLIRAAQDVACKEEGEEEGTDDATARMIEALSRYYDATPDQTVHRVVREAVIDAAAVMIQAHASDRKDAAEDPLVRILDADGRARAYREARCRLSRTATSPDGPHGASIAEEARRTLAFLNGHPGALIFLDDAPRITAATKPKK